MTPPVDHQQEAVPGAHPEFTDRAELHHVDLSQITAQADRRAARRILVWVGVCVAVAVSAFAAIMALIALATNPDPSLGGGNTGDSNAAAGGTPAATATTHDQMAMGSASDAAAAPTIDQARGISFEPFKRVDPTVPAVPAGPVKKFTVDVYEHVTQVSEDLAPTQVWSFGVNGVLNRGTGASTPMVVDQGDRVKVTLVNGRSKAMKVTMPHSLDFHSAEIAPNKAYVDVAPGKRFSFSFTAKHPGVYMYHCATQPVLMHTGAGMVGMMIVRPKGLTPAKELFVTQQEFYLGKAGGPADMAKMQAEKPDVIAFNGYANQYKMHPIAIRKGERVRMFVLNAGPSKWTAFHVIGTVFDKTDIEGVVGHDSQTVNLAPSQGGYVEFTVDEEGNYPFVTHAFGDMVKGAAGVLHTAGAPKPSAAGH
jgi:nitrite reductase (NO-forming)